MTALEVMTLARSGELSQLSPAIKDDDTAVVGFLNLGILELYKRFPLRTDEAIITLQTAKTIYKLDGTDPNVALADPYLYLVAAYGTKADDGTSLDDMILPINEEDNPYSINTISYKEVQIPLITQGALISLIYVPKPTKVLVGQLNVELDVPDQFVESLLHYVGYRAHGAMDGNLQTESNSHYVRFETSCNKLKELGVGIAPDDIDMDERISMRCFV
jgi:hypothetical protein